MTAKTFFSNPIVITIIAILVVAGIITLLTSNSSKQKVKCCTKRDSNCKCIDYKWIPSQDPCDDPGCGGNTRTIVVPVTVNPKGDVGVGPGRPGGLGGADNGTTGYHR